MDLRAATSAPPVFGLPRVPRSVTPRPRISDALDSLLADYDLIRVRAPMGAGKTVALADWAERLNRTERVTWLTMDDRYSDRVSFWREMILGVRHMLPGRRRPLLQDCLDALDSGADPRSVLRRFITLVPRTVVVIDRADFITDEDLYRDFVWVLQYCRGIRLVFSSRARLPIDFPVISLTLDAAEADPDLFLLDLEETQALINQRGARLDALDLHSATGGHALLTRATLAAHDPSCDTTIEETAATAVRQFLELSILDAPAETELLDFMVRSSVPDTLTVALASELTGSRDAARLLNIVEEQGYGNWFQAGSTRRFRYIFAVRRHLHTRLAGMDPRETDRLTHIVIDEALSRRDPLTGFQHAVRIGDLDLASRIACDHHMVLLLSRADQVLGTLQPVPLSRLRHYPALIMAMALCHNTVSSSSAKALEFFAMAAVFARAYRGRMNPAQRLWMLTMEGAAQRFAGRLEAAVNLSTASVRVFEESPLELRDELSALEPSLYTQAALALIHDCQFQRAADMASKAITAGRRSGSVATVLLATGLKALAAIMDGDVATARDNISWLSRTRWPPGMLESYWATVYRIAQAREAMDRQEYDEARGYLDLINPEMRVSEFWPNILTLDLYAMLLTGQMLEGRPALEMRIRRAHKAPVNSSGTIDLDCLRAGFHLLEGRPAKAVTALAHYPDTIPRVQAMRARAALLAGEWDRTLTILGRESPQLSPDGSPPPAAPGGGAAAPG